jgi:hypothetical protein
MAKKSSDLLLGDVVIADGEPLNLYNRYLAAVLAWLVPGAGHFYQRRTFKAAIFFTSITACFIIGFVVSGGRCVYASWNNIEHRWQFALQSGIGVPALPAAIQAWRVRGNQPAFFRGVFFPKNEPALFAPPERDSQLDDWHRRTASGFELGTLYTMIAGLLNILAIFDAYTGPLPPPQPKKKPTDPEDSSQANQPSEGA